MDRTQLLAHARASIMRGSKSFAAASRLFDRTTRERVWLLYAWCRACDDLADAQDHGGRLSEQDQADQRLATIRERTALAFAGKAASVEAYDLTPAMLEQVRRLAAERHLMRGRDGAEIEKELAQKMRRWGLNLTFTGGEPPSSQTEVESTSSR